MVLVIARPASKAMQWRVGQRIVAFVTTPENAPGIIAAAAELDDRADAESRKPRRLILSEALDAASQVSSIHAFETALTRRLSWASEEIPVTSEEHVVFGTLEIDGLRLEAAGKPGSQTKNGVVPT